MNLVASQPIPPPIFVGDARAMEAAEWLEANSVHLRERWRHLIDSCVVLGFDVPAESDYSDFCHHHYALECTRWLHVLEMSLS